MKKEKILKICNFISFVFALSFLLKLTRDWFVYRAAMNSAPFYVWALADAVQYLMPAAFIFLIGRILGRHKDNEEN